jgi:dihydroxyacid dehydratase/phosphogluconate dehydratase
VFLTNAFSLGMIEPEINSAVLTKLDLEEARDALANGFVSAVGHADTATLLSELLGMTVPVNRINVTLKSGTKEDTVLVAQYQGPRLPEGIKELPFGAGFIFWLVKL